MRFADHKFLVAAFVLHLAVPVAAAIAPDPTWRRGPLAPRVAPTEIEVEAPDLPDSVAPSEPTEPSHEEPASTEGQPERPRTPSDAAPRDASEPSPADADAEPPPVQREPEPVAHGAETSPDAFPSPEPGTAPDPMSRPPSQYEVGGPGLGPGFGTLPFGALPPDAVGRPAAPTETRRRSYEPEAARRAIDKSMRVKDSQLGLDFPAASAIAAALREAVRGSDAPFDCQGSFSVTVNPAGRVTGVSLGGYTGGDPATWQLVRKSALTQLSSRVFEMKSSFARGAVVGVTIRSEHKLPGGGLARQGASFSFDVADVGAKPVRVVSMSFSAKPLE